MDFQLVRATETDLPFIMATERREGYDAFVGRWDEARHCKALGDDSHAYFVGIAGSVPIGFVILRDWASAERVTLVKRMAVVTPGQGQGRMLLAAAVDRVFVETEPIGSASVFSRTTTARGVPMRLSASRLKALRTAARFSRVCIVTNWSWRSCGRSGKIAPDNQSRSNRAITGTWSDGRFV